ncbi:NTP pyrophosphohydrolase [Nocardioides baekrokdamisoli]|uniref:NAD(+) diphosphatase n=1 Tax=Nocardioides baekrokdamisoli TaxID=1804624 RepID=A0A3G9IYW2_9ACTN|nr:NAD(+) diphosphatase [Nocardioides baekrokdamisoli]BBH17573.1 NTP pyrophosphohydrolase [Nocardioides baekrokdamisoli]
MDPASYVLASHDRAAHLRADPVEADVWITVGNGRVRVSNGRLDRGDTSAGGADVFLGVIDGTRVAASVVERIEPKEEAVDLRAGFGLLDTAEIGLAAHAVAMARWIEATRFCAKCGHALTLTKGGHIALCASCSTEHYPRTDSAVIMALTDQDDRLLLARNTAWPAGMMSVLAGFVEPGESLEDAVRREIAEEVGLHATDVEYVGSQPWPFPSSIMLGFAARTSEVEITIDPTEIAEARWFTRAELQQAVKEDGLWVPPRGVSISTHLIERWYGGPV